MKNIFLAVAVYFGAIIFALFWDSALAQVPGSSDYGILESIVPAGGTMTGPFAFNVCTQVADDTTPAMGTIPGGCNVLETSDANTGATAITTLDGPILPGMIVWIVGGGGTYPTSIADSGNFNLETGWDGASDRALELYVQAVDDFIEIGRLGGPRVFDNTAIVELSNTVRGSDDYVMGFEVRDSGNGFLGVTGGAAAKKTYVFNAEARTLVGDPHTGDSRTALYKGVNRNYAANDSSFNQHGLGVSVRNESGGTVGTMKGGEFGVNNKSGATASTMKVIDATLENYGTINGTSHLIVAKFDHRNETASRGDKEYGVWVTNSDNSTANACDAGYYLDDSGTNTGWDYGLDMSEATIGTAEIRMQNEETVKNTTDGKIAMTGVGGSNNEDAVFDFETTADTIGISSSTSVTTWDWGAIALAMGGMSMSGDLDMNGNDIHMEGGSLILEESGITSIDAASDGNMVFKTEGGERMRLVDAQLGLSVDLDLDDNDIKDGGTFSFGAGVLSAGVDIGTAGTGYRLDDASNGASSSTLYIGNESILASGDIGVSVQAHGDVLDDFNTLTAATADGQFIVATGAGAFAYESGSTARDSLGLGVGDSPQWTTPYLTGGVKIGADSTDNQIDDASNGAGSTTLYIGNESILASGDIGSSVQAQGAALDDLSALGAPASDGQFIVASGAGAFAYESGSTARDSIGLGASDSPSFTSVSLSGGITQTGTSFSMLNGAYTGDADGKQVIATSLDDATGDEYGISHTCTVNKATSGTTYCDYVNMVDTASPGTAYLGWWGVDGAWKAYITDGGVLKTIGTIQTSGNLYSGTASGVYVGSIGIRGMTSGQDIKTVPTTFGNTVTALEDDTSAALFGNATSLGSVANATSNGTAVLTKAGHGLTLAAGDLCHITDATTAADEGYYQVESSDATTITLDRALAGSDADVDAKFYEGVLAIFDSDGTVGMWMRNFANDAPLQIGGATRKTAGSATSGEDTIIGNKLEVDGNGFFDAQLSVVSHLNLTGDTANTAIGGGETSDIWLQWNASQDQYFFGVGSNYGRQVVFGDGAYLGKDFGHAADTEFIAYVHGPADPTVGIGGDQWLSFSHDGTTDTAGDATFATGDGNIILDPADGKVIFDATSFETAELTRAIIVDAGAVELGPTAPDQDFLGTYGTLGFDADAEKVALKLSVPVDWAGNTDDDITLRIIWTNESGDAIQQNETVKWDVSYRCLDMLGSPTYDSGSATTASVTYTEAADPGVDKEIIYSDITLDADDADNPLVSGYGCGFQFDRDVGGDTYTGEAYVLRWTFLYTSDQLPTRMQ